MVNLHFSLLPRWRGAAPVERAILAGDAETGVCLMKVEAGLDTGPVYAVPTRAPRRRGRRSTSSAARLVAVGERPPGRHCSPAGCPACPNPCRSTGSRHRREDHRGGSPPGLGGDRGAADAGRAARSSLDDVPGRRLTVLQATAGDAVATAVRTLPVPCSARRWRRAPGPWCSNGCSPRAVHPCQRRRGCVACARRRRAPRNGLTWGR